MTMVRPSDTGRPPPACSYRVDLQAPLSNVAIRTDPHASDLEPCPSYARCASAGDAVLKASGVPCGILTRIRHEQLDSIAAGHIR